LQTTQYQQLVFGGMNDKLTLYYDVRSPSSMRTVLYMLEAGFTNVDLVEVSLQRGDHKSESFTRLNPRQEVPVLVDGDVVVYESSAICDYLGRVHPNERLWPTQSKRKAAQNVRLIHEFHEKLESKSVNNAVMIHNMPRERLESANRIEPLLHEVKFWEAYLRNNGKAFFVDNDVAAADVIIFGTLGTMFLLLGLPEVDYPVLSNWYHKMRARPTVASLKFWEAIASSSRPEWRVLEKKTKPSALDSSMPQRLGAEVAQGKNITSLQSQLEQQPMATYPQMNQPVPLQIQAQPFREPQLAAAAGQSSLTAGQEQQQPKVIPVPVAVPQSQYHQLQFEPKQQQLGGEQQMQGQQGASLTTTTIPVQPV
jgi:glutathione S-transferase